MLKFVSDLRQVGDFHAFHENMAEILPKIIIIIIIIIIILSLLSKMVKF